MISRPALATNSAAILAYEVLLVRLFAIVQWHHFAFMAISVALLGFGISGTLLGLAREWMLRRAHAVFTASAMLFGFAAPAAFLVAQTLPFNALEVVWAPWQLLYLGVIYLLLAVPFTAGATCIGIAFLICGTAVSRVYLWNLLGSGVGALGIVAALFALPPVACLALTGLLGVAAAALEAVVRAPELRFRALAAVVSFAVAVLVVGHRPWMQLQISEYKDLSQALAVGDARLMIERSGPLALLSVVESPEVPFRYAPGLSLLSPALPPPQLGIFADGESAGAINVWEGRPDSLAYLDMSTDALAYHLTSLPEVLVLGAGGGRLAYQAVGHDARRIDVVEPNPDLLRLVQEDFADSAGHLYDRPEVDTYATDPRRFLTGASHR